MKHYIYIVVAFITTLTIFSSCTLESSDNGDLDGFWHLEAIDTLSTGGHLDMSNYKIFWGVQAKLISLQGSDNSFYLRFNQTGDSLIVNTPYYNHWHEDAENGGDIPVTDGTAMKIYGINALTEPFLKEKLNGSKMILKSSTLRLYFTKF
nr:lipocalin-like domain-containing protein [Prevotella sp.]